MGAGLPRAFGRYELVAELGRGGMAEVFVARLVGVGGFAKTLAIKKILPHLSHDPQFVAMFMNEAKVAARLSHANICQVFELGQENGELFIVMELLDGLGLDRVIAARGALDLRFVAGVLAQAAEGLQFAHELPVIHRDVSPQNLFVTTDGTCKVLDFGVAKLTTEGTRTRTGVLKGKLPYMSPEQIRGEPLDGRSDVFALAVVAWEALAGVRLFDRDTDFLIWKAISEEPIPELAPRRPDLPVQIDAVLQRALARDRNYRFASPRDFAAALAALSGSMAARELAELVRATVPVARAAAPGSTVRDERGPPEPSTASTVHSRPGNVGERPTSASTVDDLPRASEPSVVMRKDAVPVARAPRRRGLAVAIGVLAVAGAAVATAVVATRGDRDAPRSEPAAATEPAPQPRAEPVVTAEPAPQPRAEPVVTAEPAPQPHVERTAPSEPAPPPRAGPTAATRPAPKPRAEPTAATKPAPVHRGGLLTDDNIRDIDEAAAILQQLGGSNAVHADTLRQLGELAPAARGTLSIDSSPRATISVDNEDIGDTPIVRHPLAAGGHHIVARSSTDGTEKALDVEIKAGRDTRVPKLAW